jgi:acyl-coenzyme A synthetase/AMP-(fatty) acid ligase
MQLLATAPPRSPLIWHGGEAVSRAGFTHAAWQLAQRLPKATHCINLCASRLGFMLGLIAAALRGQITLLPPNQSAGALQHLQTQFPHSSVWNGEGLAELDWRTESSRPIELDTSATAALLYTSGSTGVPEAHAKLWRNLWRVGELDAARFAASLPLNLIATVPSQHMYGLQTTVLMPLLSACAVHDSQPFFPADVREALAAVAAPRALVTTPAHLRILVESKCQLPALNFILSATAPLSPVLAQQAESLWHAPVLEIYGSTEVGTIATRRTTAGDAWQLQSGVSMEFSGDDASVNAAHLSGPQPLSDRVEMLSPESFRLLGRASDQIKVAGKRATLSELTQSLLSVVGVSDGVVFMPEGASRTAALAVAPGLHAAQVLQALEPLMESVFLPRPLLLMAQLPRNAVGKLTHDALQLALEQGARR